MKFLLLSVGYAGCAAGPVPERRHDATTVDCSAYFEKYLQKGPRPDSPNPISNRKISDLPDEFGEAQMKHCEDQLDLKLWRKWLREKEIEISQSECDKWQPTDNRGPRPDFQDFELTEENQKKYGLNDLPSDHLVELYCKEILPEKEIEDSATTEAPATVAPTVTVAPIDVVTTEEPDDGFAKNAREVFDESIFASENQIYISRLDICKTHADICCPLFQTHPDNVMGFKEETVSWLENETAKAACASDNFMPCCVKRTLCDVYPDLPHCSELITPKIVKTTTTTATTTTTTTTTTTKTEAKTTTTVVVKTVAPDNANADAIIGDDRQGAGGDFKLGGGGGVDDAEEAEAKEKSAKTGMIILFVILGLICLLVAAVLIARKFWVGTAEPAPIAKGEDDSLIATNVEEQSQIQEENATQTQQTQQQTQQTQQTVS